VGDIRNSLEVTRQRLAVSQALISESRRQLRSAAMHLRRSGAAIAAAQRSIERAALVSGGPQRLPPLR
jgi:hypothetical protein